MPAMDNRIAPAEGMKFGMAQDQHHKVDVDIALNTVVLDPQKLKTSDDEIIGAVKVNYDGGGDLRTTIHEGISRG